MNEEKLIGYLVAVGEALLILLVGYIVMRVALKILGKALDKTNVDKSLHTFIANGAKVVLWIVLIVTVLGSLGIPTTTFIAVLGACGAAIALALKDSLGNVAGGIIILVTKPFKSGDHININNVEGRVETIDLLVTTLKTFDNKVIKVPNGTISTSVLINYSSEDNRRVDCCFGIGYNDDITKAKEILANIADAHPDIFTEPGPVIGVSGQRDSCIALDLKVWCRTEDYWDIKYFLEENVKLAFDEAGISIPFPQLDVHMKK